MIKVFKCKILFHGSGASNLEELQSLLCHHVMIRRLKKDVLTQLPPKQRQKITFPIKDSPLKRVWSQQNADLFMHVSRHLFLYLFIDYSFIDIYLIIIIICPIS